MDSTTENSPERKRDLFPDMPASLKKSVKRGFEVLANTTNEIQVKVLNDALSQMANPVSNSSTDEGELAVLLGVSEKDASAAKNATLAVAHTINTRDDLTQQSFIKAAVQEDVLQSEHAEKIGEFFNSALKLSDEIKTQIDLSFTDDDVLPTLRLFEVSVDMKLKFDQSGISKMTPMAVLHLDTESYLQEIWLQISKRQLEKIIDELNTVHAQMKIAEATAATLLQREG